MLEAKSNQLRPPGSILGARARALRRLDDSGAAGAGSSSQSQPQRTNPYDRAWPDGGKRPLAVPAAACTAGAGQERKGVRAVPAARGGKAHRLLWPADAQHVDQPTAGIPKPASLDRYLLAHGIERDSRATSAAAAPADGIRLQGGVERRRAERCSPRPTGSRSFGEKLCRRIKKQLSLPQPPPLPRAPQPPALKVPACGVQPGVVTGAPFSTGSARYRLPPLSPTESNTRQVAPLCEVCWR